MSKRSYSVTATSCLAAPHGDAPVNNLLRALRPKDRALLARHLEEVRLAAGSILYEPGEPIRHVFFPCNATLLAFRVLLNDGSAIETALVGCEGALAGVVSNGNVPAFCRAEVQYGGPALRMGLAELEWAKTQSPTLRYFFARYADCLISQIFQAGACNAAHTVEQRAAKWLISTAERTGSPRIALTQEDLAGKLGVGRSHVNDVIRRMKREGMVTAQRGAVIIENLKALQRLSCGCEGAVRQHFDEVLKGVYPDQPISKVQ